jgi:hypothetical protein
MRKFATTALTALTISLLGSAAALADAPYQGQQSPGYNQPYSGPQQPGAPRGNGQWNQNQQGGQYGDRRHDDDRYDDDDRFGGERGYDDRGRYNRDHRFNDRNFNFQLQFGNFDRWERGWGYGTYQNQYRFHRQLNTWQIVRRLEAQGYYGVRGLQKARFGFGYRAFAFNYRGRPVMLRVNPFTGRVMDVRYI